MSYFLKKRRRITRHRRNVSRYDPPVGVASNFTKEGGVAITKEGGVPMKKEG